MEESLKRKAHGGAFKEEKRSESSHADEEDCKDQDIPVKDNELDSAKAEMHEVREENKRLRTCLDKMMKDYQSLQTQFNNIVHEKDSPKKSPYNRALSHQENRQQKHETPDFDVSLSLGRSSSSELRRDNVRKHSSSPQKAETSTKTVEQDKDEGLRLGLDCRFDRQPSVLSKEGLPESSPEHSLDDEKEVQAQKSEKAPEDDEVSHQNPAKKARVSVRVRCDTPTMIDGCQWRKYGQKIAKGNPCPRAYYRCSVTASCPVRKQVQRCSQDMSILITTYEGTHNHTLPVAAHAMASTTSAAAGMILSGSSTSGIGSSGASNAITTPAELHGLNYYLSNNSTSSRPPFYLPNSSISSSSSYPSITLDLTSSSSSMTNNFPPRYNVNSSSTNLNFSSSLESNSNLPIFWSNGNNYQLQNYAKNSQMGPSLNFGRQHQENFYPYSYMQKNNNDNVAQAHQAMQMDKNSIESATKAITADPNFQSALAAAITSMIGSNNNISGGGQNVKLEQSFPVLSSFLSNSQASNMRPVQPPLPNSSSKSKSTSPEDNRDQVTKLAPHVKNVANELKATQLARKNFKAQTLGKAQKAEIHLYFNCTIVSLFLLVLPRSIGFYFCSGEQKNPKSFNFRHKMVQLYLSEPAWDDVEDDASVKQRISLLTKLEIIILSLMSSGGRSEARLWLCNTLSSMRSINPQNQQEIFVKLLRSKPRKLGLASQLLQMIFEKRPKKVGAILAKKSHMLEDFFRGHPDRIMQWFSSFAGSGDLQHRKGAKALSQFAFVNRDICWEELEWKGKHGQSPAVVATKPHYFLDIDIQQTVENFLENVPEFWSSREFAESLEGGEILFMDSKFFVQLFLDLMYKVDSKETWEVINEFLMEESFSSLCQHLLIVLEEKDLLLFLELSRKFLKLRREHMDTGTSSYWFEVILSKFSISYSLDQLLMLNAVVNKGRQLVRLIREEEAHEEKMQIQDIVLQVCVSSCHPNSLAPLMVECLKTRSLNSIKWLGLQSFALHYRLSEESQTHESWEIMFRSNGISFRNSENYPLLNSSGFSEDIVSDSDERSSVGVKRRKKEKHRKRRRKHLDHDESNNDFFDLDFSNNSPSLLSKSSSWLLSTDGYSTAWTTVDLPEHLSMHCFSTWMKWIFAKWDIAD